MHSIVRRFLMSSTRISLLQPGCKFTQSFAPPLNVPFPALPTITFQHRNFATRNYVKQTKQSPGTLNFLTSVKDEISHQTTLAADLPEIEGFESKIKDMEVTFTKEVKGVKFSFSVNANEKLIPEILSEYEADGMEENAGMGKEMIDDDSQEMGENQECTFLPLININIEKPSGHRLEVACSFNPEGESLQNIIESGLQINEVKVRGPGDSEEEDIYTLEGSNFDDNIYDSLVEYLEEGGMDDNFLNQLIYYFQIFERRVYINEFLYKLSNFLKS